MSTAFDTFLGGESVLEAFDAASMVGAMLRVERALCAAQASIGALPQAAAHELLQALDALPALDADAVARESTAAGTLAAPFLTHLRAALQAKGISDQAMACLHWGATSQDVLDMALALQIQAVLRRIESQGKTALQALLTHAHAHRATPMLARTLMQPAACTSFGLKCAQWAAPLARSLSAVRTLERQALRVQLGGAAGNQLVWRSAGVDIAAMSRALSQDLGLADSPVPTHTQSDDGLRLAAELALLAGAAGKIAGDLALLAQFEVAEVFEPSGEGKGISTAMPHKRNPAGCLTALAAAQRAPHLLASMLAGQAQQHERSLGAWQLQLGTWPHLLAAAAAAIDALAQMLRGLDVRPDRMRANLQAVQSTVGEEAAHAFFDEAHVAHAAALCDAQVAALASELAALAIVAPQ